MTISQDEVYLTCIINYITIKMKNKNIYHTDGTVPISNQKIIETDKIYTPSIHIHDNSLYWLRESCKQASHHN